MDLIGSDSLAMSCPNIMSQGWGFIECNGQDVFVNRRIGAGRWFGIKIWDRPRMVTAIADQRQQFLGVKMVRMAHPKNRQSNPGKCSSLLVPLVGILGNHSFTARKPPLWLVRSWKSSFPQPTSNNIKQHQIPFTKQHAARRQCGGYCLSKGMKVAFNVTQGEKDPFGRFLGSLDSTAVR